MAQINKPNEYFNTKLYTGNGTSQSVTGVGFQPDLIWVKERSSTSSHQLVDAVRGVYRRLIPNGTNAESDDSGSPNDFNSFDSDGFSILAGGAVNENSQTYAAWNWLAGGTGVSNTDGSITSTVSVNTTSGFSIVSYTGTGANATVGHGLGVAPKMIIVKSRSGVFNWGVYHESIGNTKYLELNETTATQTSSTLWQNTTPTSSFFSLGSNNTVNQSSGTYIAYCFAEKKGFSKFGSYVGNGSADGTFIYTGFKPAMVIFKNASTVTNWGIVDNKRDDDNVVKARLFPNLSDTEASNLDICDFTSNGFKLRITDSQFNGSGNTMIYMAFAENPLVGTNNIPATAR